MCFQISAYLFDDLTEVEEDAEISICTFDETKTILQTADGSRLTNLSTLHAHRNKFDVHCTLKFVAPI